MAIMKAGCSLIGHRSRTQSSCGGPSGLLPYQDPDTQVFPQLRIHPLGFLKLCLSNGAHPDLVCKRKYFTVMAPTTSQEVTRTFHTQPLLPGPQIEAEASRNSQEPSILSLRLGCLNQEV